VKQKNVVVNPKKNHVWIAKSAHGVYVGATKKIMLHCWLFGAQE
jgi:hypothetical protein